MVFNTSRLIKRIADDVLMEHLNVPMVGILDASQKNGSYAVLDVPQDFIDSVYEAIKEPGMEKPDDGAHISVMSGDELDSIKPLEEDGNKYEIKIMSLGSVEPDNWDEMERVWFVKCRSPQLEELRQKYGFTPLMFGKHEFHITIAVKKKIDEKKARMKSAVRGVLAFVYGWIEMGGDNVAILRTKKWPGYFIKPTGDKFKVMVYRSKQAVNKLIAKNLEYYLEKFVDYGYVNKGLLNFSDMPKIQMKQIMRKMEYVVRKDFFKTNHPVETTTILPRLLGKNIFISKEFTLSKQKLFDLLVGKEKFPPDVFEQSFGPVEIGDDDGRFSHLKHRKWNIFVDSESKRNLDDAIALLDAGEKYLTKKGLGKLAYGKVFIVDKLRGKPVADYGEAGDLMRIEGPSADTSPRNVWTIIHELGHRNYHKFLSGAQRTHSNLMYDGMKAKKQFVKRGDIVVSVEDPGDRYRVVDKKGKTYYLNLIETESTDKNIGDSFKVKDQFIGTFVTKENRQEDKERSSFFPKPYGMKNKFEFYAVLFETWLMNKLKDPAKTWFEDLHKG